MKKITVEGLFKDAAFLADKDKGIPHFCVEPEERGEFWKNLTKHKAGKPVAQALDAILAGRSFNEAIERFLRNVSVKIAQNEQKDLGSFVGGVREILKKFFALRQDNISEFLKAKNSFLSAIFILTRYPNLRKEVCNE